MQARACQAGGLLRRQVRRRAAVQVAAAGRIPNKELLDVVKSAAEAGAKVGPGDGHEGCTRCAWSRCGRPARPPGIVLHPRPPMHDQGLATSLMLTGGARGRGQAAEHPVQGCCRPGHRHGQGAVSRCLCLCSPCAPFNEVCWCLLLKASEESILSVIQSAFPGHAILGEEGGVYVSGKNRNRACWGSGPAWGKGRIQLGPCLLAAGSVGWLAPGLPL